MTVNDRPLCRRCGTDVTGSKDVLFPKVGGVEHLGCTREPMPPVHAPKSHRSLAGADLDRPASREGLGDWQREP